MKKVLIIGAGAIAEEYLRVIKANKSIKVSCIFSRTFSKAFSLSKKFKIKYTFVNKKDLIKNRGLFDAIIIAVNIESNLNILKFCLKLKKKILIEKPIALNFTKNKSLKKLNKNIRKNIFVAMNRRFFDSTIFLNKKLINSKQKRIVEVYDCQNESFFPKNKFHTSVRKNLMYANSIHLIDYFNIFCRGEISKVDILKKTYDNKSFLTALLKFTSGDIGHYFCDLNYLSKWKVRVGLNNEIWSFLPLETISYYDLKTKRKKFYKFKTKYKDGFYNQVDEFRKLLNRKKSNLVNFDDYFKTIILINKIYGK